MDPDQITSKTLHILKFLFFLKSATKMFSANTHSYTYKNMMYYPIEIMLVADIFTLFSLAFIVFQQKISICGTERKNCMPLRNQPISYCFEIQEVHWS